MRARWHYCVLIQWSSCTTWIHTGRAEAQLHSLLTWALEGGELPIQAPTVLAPENPCTHWIAPQPIWAFTRKEQFLASDSNLTPDHQAPSLTKISNFEDRQLPYSDNFTSCIPAEIYRRFRRTICFNLQDPVFCMRREQVSLRVHGIFPQGKTGQSSPIHPWDMVLNWTVTSFSLVV